VVVASCGLLGARFDGACIYNTRIYSAVVRVSESNGSYVVGGFLQVQRRWKRRCIVGESVFKVTTKLAAMFSIPVTTLIELPRRASE
jgi:hypothetical protein